MRFYTFGNYLKSIFGERVQRLSLNAGFTCPNLDGKLDTAGCIYCNNYAFSPFAGSCLSLEEQISASIEFYQKKMKVNKFIAYFQSYSNTYASVEKLEKNYSVIKKFPLIVGLFISTRPDCVDEEKIKLIAAYKSKYLVWIEYGLQTTDNLILKFLNRHHSYEDFLSALELTRRYQINVGVHIILGLGENFYKTALEDAAKLSQLDIQGVKFHLLHILKDTTLEEMYNKSKIKIMDKETYISCLCDFLERIPKNFVVLRLVSSAHPSYLVEPKWLNETRRDILEDINKELERRGTYQGYYCKSNETPYQQS